MSDTGRSGRRERGPAKIRDRGPAETPRPFLGSASGIGKRRLRTYRKLLRGVYIDQSMYPTALVMARAAWLYGRGGAVLGGRSAAAVLGAGYLDERRPRGDSGSGPAGAGPEGAGPEGGGPAGGDGPGVRRRYREHDWSRYVYFDPEPPVLIRPRNASMRAGPGVRVHRVDLPADEVTTVDGMRVTTPARTGFDLARWPASAAEGWDAGGLEDFDRRVALLDSLCVRPELASLAANGHRTTPARIAELAGRHPRAAGVARALAVLPWVDGGAASPRETRLRLLFVREGFPVPVTQFEVVNEYGVSAGRIDLSWPRWKVGVEYDGSWHRGSDGQRADDSVRTARFAALGWDVLHVGSELMRMRAMLLGLVADKLRMAGCRAPLPQ